MSDINNNEQNQSSEEKQKKGKTSLVSRLFHGTVDGASNVVKNAKTGASLGKTAFKAGFKQVMTKPLALTLATTVAGVGSYGAFVAYDQHKHDNLIELKTDTWECVPGTIEQASGSGAGDNDIQENVNIMYDLFVNELGYSDNFLVGLLACMYCESHVDPDRLESDFVLTGPKEAFDSAVGKGSGAKGSAVLDAYHAYGDAYAGGGGWNGNSAYFDDDGGMACGIGLIQWTGGRGKALCMGTEKISQDYSVVDLPYQLAFLVAEINDKYDDLTPDSFSAGSDAAAIEEVFTKLINGSDVAASTQLPDRLAMESEARGWVSSAAANSEYTADMVSMIEVLSEDGVVASQHNNIGINLCANGTQLDTSAIAKAAVSVAWLEYGEYVKESKAVINAPDNADGTPKDNVYNKSRRSVFASQIINDWDYIEGVDGTRGSEGDIHSASAGPKYDLLACTEFYYYAHKIVLPDEEETAGKPAWFSSCDRSACVPVRMAGADDLFPAGNPDWQLKYSLGHARGATDVMLWDPAGFMRGTDLYSYSGGTSISPGTLMISWDIKAANGKLGGTEGLATTGEGEADEGSDEDSTETDAALKEAKIRYVQSKAESHNHIIVYVGRGSVTSNWTPDFLLEQYHAYPDCENLIKADLTIQGAKEMNKGKSVKSSMASKASEFRITFYDTDPVQTNQLPFEDTLEGDAGGSHVWDNGEESARFTDQTSEPASEFITEWNEKSQEERAKKSKVTDREDTVYNPRTGLLEYRAWSEIMWALMHNDDTEVWYNKAKETGFYNDWKDDDQGGEGNYQPDDWKSTGANNNGVIAHRPLTSAPHDIYWMFSLITDYEYRAQQFERFGISAAMCSTATEEDSDIYQYDKDKGILGNVYKYIADQWDDEGSYKNYVIPSQYHRYLYFDTVVSNDLLQDLMQLYTYGMNYADESTYEAANLKSLKLIDEEDPSLNNLAKMGARYISNVGVIKADNVDRRYALTANDIAFIKGQTKFRLGMDGDEAWDLMKSYITTPLYNKNGKNTVEEHEGEGPYEYSGKAQNLYGFNPFVDSVNKKDEAYMINPLNRGIDDDDQWMSLYNNDAAKYMWIQDHYYYFNRAGSVDMIAYMVLDFNKDGRIDYSEFYKNESNPKYKDQLFKWEHQPLNDAVHSEIEAHDDYIREYEVVRYPGDYNFIDDELWDKMMDHGIYDRKYLNKTGKDITDEKLFVYTLTRNDTKCSQSHSPIMHLGPCTMVCAFCESSDHLPSLSLNFQYDDLNDLYERLNGYEDDCYIIKAVELEGATPGGSHGRGAGNHGSKIKFELWSKCKNEKISDYAFDFGKVEEGDPNFIDEGGEEGKYDHEKEADGNEDGLEGDGQKGYYNDGDAPGGIGNRRWLKQKKNEDVYAMLRLVENAAEPFNVDDYMDGGEIKYFQNDIMIQIPYGPQGWIDDTAWREFEDFDVKGYGEKCGCGAGHDTYFHIHRGTCKDYQLGKTPAATSGNTRSQPQVDTSEYEPYYKAFSVEGDVICATPSNHSELKDGCARSDTDGQYVLFADTSKKCTCKGLYMVQSIRNKVSYGKDSKWDDAYSTMYITEYPTCRGCTNVNKVKFTTEFGEEDVIGRQREKNILDGDYKEDPDRATSMCRVILGLDHVFHVKLIGQDIDEAYEDIFTHELTSNEHPTKNEIGIDLNGGKPDDSYDNELLSEGDFAHWVVHGSRGTRGPKCQYLEFSGFFGIADSELKDNNDSVSWVAPSYLDDPEEQPSKSNIDFTKVKSSLSAGDSKSQKKDQNATSIDRLKTIHNYQYMLMVNTPAEDRKHGGKSSIQGLTREYVRLKVPEGEEYDELWTKAVKVGKDGVAELYVKPPYTYDKTYDVNGIRFYYGSGSSSRWKQLIDNFNYRERNSWDASKEN